LCGDVGERELTADDIQNEDETPTERIHFRCTGETHDVISSASHGDDGASGCVAVVESTKGVF